MDDEFRSIRTIALNELHEFEGVNYEDIQDGLSDWKAQLTQAQAWLNQSRTPSVRLPRPFQDQQTSLRMDR